MILDEYWVLSGVLESLGGQARQGWWAFWIASAVAIVATLGLATQASGQTTPPAAGAEPAEVAPELVSEPASPPTAAPAEEPAVTVAAEEPAEAALPTPAAPQADAAEDAASSIAATVRPEADRPVSGTVAKTVGVISEAATKTQVTERLPEPTAQVAKRAAALSDEARTRAIEIVVATENAILPALPRSGDAPAGPAAPAPVRPLPLHQAPVGMELLTGAWLGHLADGTGGPPTDQGVAGAAATDLLRVGAPGGLGELRAAPSFSATDFFTDPVQRFSQPASPSSPGFPLSLTTDFGAPGSGATFFVPIAALLALLALASPAILRRLRELPDFPAPTPFVCALERPG